MLSKTRLVMLLPFQQLEKDVNNYCHMDGITHSWAFSYDRSSDRQIIANWMDNAHLYTVTK